MDEKDEPVVSIVAGGETPPPPANDPPADPPPANDPPADPPPANDPPPADAPPPDDPPANLPAELPCGFAELYVPTLTEMAEQLGGDLGLDRSVARERIELAARAIHEHYHLPLELALGMLQRMPTQARAVLFAQTAHEQALVATYIEPVPDLE